MEGLVLDPVSRMVMPGSNAMFRVRLGGGGASSIRVTPCKEASEYAVIWPEEEAPARVTSDDRTFTIEVPLKAGMA